jgi:hypothetical protein
MIAAPNPERERTPERVILAIRRIVRVSPEPVVCIVGIAA